MRSANQQSNGSRHGQDHATLRRDNKPGIDTETSVAIRLIIDEWIVPRLVEMFIEENMPIIGDQTIINACNGEANLHDSKQK